MSVAALLQKRALANLWKVLLRICSVFCQLTPLFLQKIMDDDFQKRFLGRSKSTKIQASVLS